MKTREPESYKRLFNYNIEGQAGSEVPNFPVSVGNAKGISQTDFHLSAQKLEY